MWLQLIKTKPNIYKQILQPGEQSQLSLRAFVQDHNVRPPRQSFLWKWSQTQCQVFFPIYFWMIPWECSILLSWGRFITLQIKVGNITTESLFKKLCQRRLNARSPEARLSISVASKRECLKLPGQKTTTGNLAHINLPQECLHSYLPIDVKFWGHTCVRGNHSWSKKRQLVGQRITCNELLPGKIMCLPVHKFTYFNNI